MKTRFYITIALAFVFSGNVMAQTAATTPDNAASPAATCGASTLFPAPANYSPSAGVQLGVNNTGTDLCQVHGFTRVVQAMVWDNVTNISGSTITSSVHVSWMVDGGTPGSYTFVPAAGETGGFDPDVAIFSDANGTFMQVVFENNTTGKIDGYTFKLNGTNFALFNPYKSTLCNNATKKAKNPNIATTKNLARFAVVWHEEGLVNPPQTLTITYSTTPPFSYTNTVAVMESKVYIHVIDKVAYQPTLLGSPTASPILNAPGTEVERTAPANSNQLFGRNFNPDVSYGEEVINSSPNQAIASVVFLTQYFNPATFSIVTDQLSVVQGTADYFTNRINTNTVNFTTTYSGKPRIAARHTFNGTVTARDFGVVMGNSTSIISCTGTTQSSKINFWYVQTGGTIACPAGGFDLINSTSYATPTVTSVDPVISCVHGRGYYDIAFSTNINNATNAFDVVANTFKEGGLVVTAGAFSAVNRGVCTSVSMIGNQVIPSVASFRKPGASDLLAVHSNYLFWDQKNKTVNYKQITNNTMPGGGASLRQMQDASDNKSVRFIGYPNPTDTEIAFGFELGEKEVATEIEIFNLLGQSVDKFAVNKELTEQRRDVSKLPSGSYISVLKTNVQTHKLEFIKR
jgi:type IX secretion system substrate protein